MSLELPAPKTPERNALTSLFLSVTNKCNITCSYCSADAGPAGRNRLSPDVALKRVEEWLSGAPDEPLMLVFSGGEPTLWGYPNLDAVCAAARNLADRSGRDLRIGIQTNGTVISPRFITFCRTWRVEPSISLDGLAEISDQQRGKAAATVAGLRRLLAADVPFAVICCLTRSVAENLEAILEFYREEGFRKVRINFLGDAPIGRSTEQLSSTELFAAKLVILRHMQRYGADGVVEKNLTDQIQAFQAVMRGRRPNRSHCQDLQCGAGRQIAAVNPDGAISMCIEKSMTDGLPTASSLTSLAEQASDYWAEFGGWSDCGVCPASSICDHGCPVYHKLEHDRFLPECHATKALWNHLVKLHRLTPAILG